MATSDEFKEQRSNRKRKREINEEETAKMDTEQTSSAPFPQINPSQLKVKFNVNKTRNKIIFF